MIIKYKDASPRKVNETFIRLGKLGNTVIKQNNKPIMEKIEENISEVKNEVEIYVEEKVDDAVSWFVDNLNKYGCYFGLIILIIIFCCCVPKSKK